MPATATSMPWRIPMRTISSRRAAGEGSEQEKVEAARRDGTGERAFEGLHFKWRLAAIEVGDQFSHGGGQRQRIAGGSYHHVGSAGEKRLGVWEIDFRTGLGI